MDKKAEIARHKHAIKFHENQINYLNGKITWEEFEKETKNLEMIDVELQELQIDLESGKITDNEYKNKKDKINRQIIEMLK